MSHTKVQHTAITAASEITWTLRSLQELLRWVHVHGQAEESSESLGWQMMPVRENSRPLLDRIYYVHDFGREMSEKSSASFSMQHDAKDEKVASRAMTMIGSGSDYATRKVVVKVERPEFQEIKQQLGVLKSAKASLEKIVSQALDLQASLLAKNPEKTELAEKVTEVVAAINQNLTDLRGHIVKVSGLKAKDADSFEGIKEANARFIAAASAHNDGWKVLKQHL